jgi:hypothetical protein
VNFHDIVSPVHVVNSLGLLIESPLSMFGMSWSPSSQVDPMVTVFGSNSLHWHSWSHVEWSVDIESELFVHSLCFNFWSLINIDNLPFLVSSSVVLVNNYWTSFSIFSSINIKDLTVLDVNELFSSILEDLPPLWVGSTNLQVFTSTIAYDVPWLVVDLGLDGQWSLIEPPDLSLLSISSLDNHVSIVDDLKISSWTQSWNNMEWSFDVKSKFFIEFTLGWLTLPFVNEDNIPLLMDLSILYFISTDMSSFGISFSLDT